MMAQGICATDGLRRFRRGQAASLGFLLGCRKFAATRSWLQPGETLTLETTCLIDSETSSYQCRVLDADGAEVANATVNVFQPADIDAYLEGTKLKGIGQASAAKLAEAGFRVIGDLREAPVETLFRLAGKDGPRLKNLANGIDPRRVTPDRETKSVSSETTLDVDLSRFDELEP
eukprot:gene29908-30392_t